MSIRERLKAAAQAIDERFADQAGTRERYERLMVALQDSEKALLSSPVAADSPATSAPQPTVRTSSQTAAMGASSSSLAAMADENGGTGVAALSVLVADSGPSARSSDARPRRLTNAQEDAWRTHWEINRLLTYQLERDLQPFGLTMNDYEILVHLSESEGHRMGMNDLASATLQSKSRLSHQITRMENADLVRRENCESDRRLYAALTDYGVDTMKKVAPHHVASVREYFIDLIPPEALEAFHKSLMPIAEHLRNQRGRPYPDRHHQLGEQQAEFEQGSIS
jgi:DNA-binding MarR family transcriptional regulator